ncbi:hypothetical protein [Solemya velum gill symbiont]|uniref:hypothetical protein n=1 Tax=Solemya velum gill symbiont TaxID=2340 RepID=UPI00117B54CF|nr:hypothetical protein [Solemya velum gill symbiont]
MSSRVEFKTREQLEAMHTGSLMKRRDALLKCDESFKLSDQSVIPPIASAYIEFKDTPEWKQAYAELKSVLATREHVSSKKERKEIRRQKAKHKR